MVSHVFVLDEAAQAYNIYLIIYVWVSTREADARDYTESSLKTQDLTSFLKYLVFRSKYLVFQISGVKTVVFRNF